MIDPFRPPAGQLTTKWLWLTRSAERFALRFLDQAQEPFCYFGVLLHPILEILECLRFKLQAHPGVLRGIQIRDAQSLDWQVPAKFELHFGANSLELPSCLKKPVFAAKFFPK